MLCSSFSLFIFFSYFSIYIIIFVSCLCSSFGNVVILVVCIVVHSPSTFVSMIFLIFFGDLLLHLNALLEVGICEGVLLLEEWYYIYEHVLE